MIGSNANGTAELSLNVPVSIAGLTVHVQAVQRRGGGYSNVLHTTL